jgi:hypothetical protein
MSDYPEARGYACALIAVQVTTHSEKNASYGKRIVSFATAGL